jgi:BirA family transcriptional regulator, biotin operon repressor / biotin---[acetyl-CoA-carboxylase] ligase
VSEEYLSHKILKLFKHSSGVWHSEADLANRFTGTPLEVKEAIQKLDLEGYPLEQSVEGIRLAPDAPFLAEILYFGTVSSTMEEIKAMVLSEAPEFTVLLAEQQLAGRGRRGKPWMAKPASGLYFTLLLRPKLATSSLGLLPLLIGACVAQGIQNETGIETLLKWSNDILSSDGRKLAGILIEAQLEADLARFVLVGIGINVRCQDFPKEFQAAALEEYAPVNRRDLLKRILQMIRNEYTVFLEHPNHAIKLWKSLPNFLGQTIRVLEPNNNEWTGIATDLDLSGGLIVQTATGSRLIHAAEVSLKRD